MLGRAAFVGVLLSSSVAMGAPRPLDRVVAVVDDGVVCLSEVRMRARPIVHQVIEQKKRPPTDVELAELHKQMVAQIIDERIIEDAARTLHIEVASEDIDHAMEHVAQAAKLTPKALLEEVVRSGLTEREYRDELRRQLLNAKWENAAVRPSMQHKSDEANELLLEREKELTRLKKQHYIEIRP